MKKIHISWVMALCLNQMEFACRTISSIVATKATPPPVVDTPSVAQGISMPIFRGERQLLYAS